VDGKKLTFQTKKEPKKSKKKAEEYREKAFAFVVHTDWSGVWPNLPACHFQAPKSVKQQMVNGKQINILNAENYENILNNTEQESNNDMTSTQNSENHLSDVKKRPPKKRNRRQKRKLSAEKAPNNEENKEKEPVIEPVIETNQEINGQKTTSTHENESPSKNITSVNNGSNSTSLPKKGVKRKKPPNSSNEDESNKMSPPLKRKRTKRNSNVKQAVKESILNEEIIDESNSRTEDDNPLPDFVDIMTGEIVEQPALSPYGHVLGYDTWCKILRNLATKDKCPFTKQKLTRRSLIKLTKENIAIHQSSIRNFTETDKANIVLK